MSTAVYFDAFNENIDFETSSYPGLVSQASVTSFGGETLFITTYISTSTVYPGQPPITTTVYDVYLKSNTIAGLSPGLETQHLSECVDPRRYLCTNKVAESGWCGTEWVGTYPMTAVGRGSSGTTPARGRLLYGELLTIVVIWSISALISTFQTEF